MRGEPKRLTVIASYEEGSSGDLSFTFTGLPEGRPAFPAIQYKEGRGPPEVTRNPELIAPKQQDPLMVVEGSPQKEGEKTPPGR
jgi:hypothetical protein